MILVTGATGFVGRALVSELLARGYETAVLVNKTPPRREWDGGAVVLRADITKEADLYDIGAYPFTGVVHLAAHIPPSDGPGELEKCIEVNALGTRNLLEFAVRRGIKRFVNSSSMMVYGETAGPELFSEEAGVFPNTYYGMSKLMAEMLCERQRRLFGLGTLSLRFSYVYGPGMSERYVLEKFLRLAKGGENLNIYGTGKGQRDFIHVKDVVEALKLSMESTVTGSINIGTGRGLSLAELAEELVKLTGSGSRIIFHGDRDGDKSLPILDISRARRHLGFSPRHGLEDGLAECLRGCATS